jgi:acyl-CoA thioesterase I
MSVRTIIRSLLLFATFLSALRAAEPRTIVFFGDSLTAGYGLDEPATEAYPALIQKKIDAAHLDWKVVNAGVSGDTSSGGRRRVDWVLRQKVDIFVLALGANDGLRGVEPAVTQANLRQIVEAVRAKYPAVKLILAGMMMPPNLGPEYTHDFAAMYPTLARQLNTALVPFLLEGVGGDAELNQRDGMHPTAEGHAILAENVWKILRPLL